MERFLELLVSHFTFLGFDLQWRMPIIGGTAALYVLWLWLTVNSPNSGIATIRLATSAWLSVQAYRNTALQHACGYPGGEWGGG